MDFSVDFTAITIVTVVFLTSALIVATVFLFVHRSRELRHQTIRLALEKGVPLPASLLEESEKARPHRSDLNSGVKAVFIGLGLSLFFFFFKQDLWPVGLIPLFIGLGDLAAHALTGRGQPGVPPAS